MFIEKKFHKKGLYKNLNRKNVHQITDRRTKTHNSQFFFCTCTTLKKSNKISLFITSSNHSNFTTKFIIIKLWCVGDQNVFCLL